MLRIQLPGARQQRIQRRVADRQQGFEPWARRLEAGAGLRKTRAHVAHRRLLVEEADLEEAAFRVDLWCQPL